MQRFAHSQVLAQAFGLLLTIQLFAVGQASGQVTLRLEDELATFDESDPGGTQFASYSTPSKGCQTCWEEQCPASGAACPTRLWGRAEYLWWQVKGNDLPALVTMRPANANQSTVAFGDGEIDDDFRSGMRFTAGLWLDDCQNSGIEASYFGVYDDRDSGNFFAETEGGTGSGDPIIERPFTSVPSGVASALRVSFPGQADGQIDISSRSEMHSASVLLRHCYRRGCRGRIDLVGGYRYFRFREGMLFEQSSVSTDISTSATVPYGTQSNLYDRFVTENDFHGGELGLVTELGSGSLSVELLAKVAVGNLHRLVAIDGGTMIQPPSPAASISGLGGFLALNGTNIGQRTDNEFAVLPEFGVNAKYALTDRLSILGGATLLMLNDVVRTGEQIDTSINPTYFFNEVPVGEARPMRLDTHVTDFWATGLNVGVQFEM